MAYAADLVEGVHYVVGQIAQILKGSSPWRYFLLPANEVRVCHQPSYGASARAVHESALGHEAEMPKYLGDVRCWVNSGKHMLALSFSVFDLGCVKTRTSRKWEELFRPEADYRG
jgi:hypothetical protein